MIGPTVMDAAMPPKIAPVSGVLGKGKVAIRPIACRPVVSSASSTPILGARSFGTADTSLDSEKLTSRSSWGQFSSTTDLRSQPQQNQQPPSLPSKLDFRPAAQRNSWTNTPVPETLESLPQRVKLAYPPGIPPNNTLTLARKFGGSLCNVSTWQQHSSQQHSMSHADKPAFQSSTTSLVSCKPSEPPAYRPAPPLKPKPHRQIAQSNDNIKNYASISKLGGSELQLDRLTKHCGGDGPLSLSSASDMCFDRLNVKCPNGLSSSEVQLHRAADKENGFRPVEAKSGHCSTLPRGSKGYSNATYTTFSFPDGRTCESNGVTDEEVIYSEPFGIDKPLLSPASFSDLVLDTPLSMESESWADLNDSMVSGRDADTPVVRDGRIRSAQAQSGSYLSLNGPNSLDFDQRSEMVTPVVHQGRIQLPSALENAKTRFRPLSENRSDGSLGSVGDFPDNSDSRSEFDPEGTPSPSDSGVAELEALIREKDSEISFLRETMEQNEAVIFKVYEEKEKSWERELRKLRLLYENRLKATQNRVLRAEHNFSIHAQQWQNERRRITQETEEIKLELCELKARLEETSWSLCEKSGEVSLLKTQLRDAQNEQSARNQEIVRLKSQVRELQESLQRSQTECQSLQQLVTNNNNNSSNLNSQEELNALKRQLAEQSHKFETEKQVWLEEKMTVLKYQKHLQLSYVKLHHRNVALEHELGQLGVTGVPMLSSSSSCSDPVAGDVDLNSSCMSDHSVRSTAESHC